MSQYDRCEFSAGVARIYGLLFEAQGRNMRAFTALHQLAFEIMQKCATCQLGLLPQPSGEADDEEQPEAKEHRRKAA